MRIGCCRKISYLNVFCLDVFMNLNKGYVFAC